MDFLANRYRLLSIKQIETHGQYFKVIASTTTHPDCCQYCRSKKLIPHGWKTIYLNDTPCYGYKVYLYVSKRRYKCGCCTRTFYEDVSYQYRNYRMTKYFAKYVRKEIKKDSLFGLSRKLRVGRPTLLNAIN